MIGKLLFATLALLIFGFLIAYALTKGSLWLGGRRFRRETDPVSFWAGFTLTGFVLVIILAAIFAN